jgi:hypothetical protein
LFSPVYSSTLLLQFAVLFYLEFMWGCASSPLSGGACHTLATVGHLPLSTHTGGGGSTPAFSSWLFIYSSHGGVPLAPSSGAFHRTATVTIFSHSKVFGRGLPHLPSLNGLFIYSWREGVPLPHSLELRVSHPVCYMSLFFLLLVYYSVCFFFLFSLGGVSLSRGLC